MSERSPQGRPPERRSGVPGGTAADRGAGGPGASLDAVLAEFRAYVLRVDIAPSKVRQMLHLAIYAHAAFEPADAIDDVVATLIIPNGPATPR